MWLRPDRILMTLGLFALALLGIWRPAEAVTFIEGYAGPSSVVQGQSLDIYVSTDAPTYSIQITRQGSTAQTVYFQGSLPGVQQTTQPQAWEVGAGWTPSFRILSIPGSWKSGVYVVNLTGQGLAKKGKAVFVVREDHPGSTANILYCTSFNTYQAYNSWGGKSLYDYNSTDQQRSYVVSCARPYANGGGVGDFSLYEFPFIKWMEGGGYHAEYCADMDLHAHPELLDSYQEVIFVGHSEYWSTEMRDAVEGMVTAGKSVAFFSGNTCWWQIRFSPDMKQIICYKNAAVDPLNGVDNARVTVNWLDAPVRRSEAIMTGVSYRYGGYHNSNGYFPASEGYGGYTVYRPWHWVYAGTNLESGAQFGTASTIVGYEVDGALFQWKQEKGLTVPAASGLAGTPSSFTILATAPASRGTATMGIYTLPGGGTVFNAATTDWSQGLASDPAVQQITRNVIDALLSHNAVGTEEPALPKLLLSAYPNPFLQQASVSFDLSRPGDVSLRVFDVQGRLVQTLLEARLPEGAARVDWRGQDAQGRAVPPGVYFLRLDSKENDAARQVVKIVKQR